MGHPEVPQGGSHVLGRRAMPDRAPGIGQTVGVAGHRTTYLAPFKEINELAPGDEIMLTMPYARFTYRVQYQRIVAPTALWVIRNVGYERLVLSACNPLYSAAKICKTSRSRLITSDVAT